VHAGKYNAPGGKLEQGETPKQAMAREVLEETGLRVVKSRKLGFLAFPGFHGDGPDVVDESMHVYLITAWEGELLPESEEGELVWVPADEVLSLPLWEGDKLYFPLVLQGRRFEGALFYRDGKLIRAEIEAEP
jgi:8-oxo-dGTP diphosphatase